MDLMPGCDPSVAVLSLLAEYHDWASVDLPPGRGRPRRTRRIEAAFAGRSEPDGAPAVAVKMDLHRPARISSGHLEVAGATFAVAIDDIEVALAPEGRRRLKLRSSVVLSIQTCLPKIWWRFLGRVTRVTGQGRTVTIRLLHSLGCVASASASPQVLQALELADRRAARASPPVSPTARTRAAGR